MRGVGGLHEVAAADEVRCDVQRLLRRCGAAGQEGDGAVGDRHHFPMGSALDAALEDTLLVLVPRRGLIS
eukprot:7014344-Alexandrium_andersonii.AAC.1